MTAENNKPLTFLIVDDDIPLSLFFKQTLLLDDHRVFVSVNEHGALEVLKTETIDILLCDLVLPGLDGSKIIEIVKEHYPEVYCVLISGYHDRIHIPNSKADRIIGKPILKETLDNIIQQFHLHQSSRKEQL